MFEDALLKKLAAKKLWFVSGIASVLEVWHFGCNSSMKTISSSDVEGK